MTGAKTGTTNAFDILPNELILAILSHLPAREIQLCRRICKHLRSLVDTKGNRAFLIRPDASSALMSIREIHASMIDIDPAQIDLLSLLDRVLLHRRGSLECPLQLTEMLWCRLCRIEASQLDDCAGELHGFLARIQTSTFAFTTPIVSVIGRGVEAHLKTRIDS